MNANPFIVLLLMVASVGLLAEQAIAQCTGSWTQKLPAAAPSRRSAPAMVYDSVRGVTVLFGGFDSNGYDNETWEWNGTSWSQRFPAASPSPRDDHMMAFDAARGVTVMFGGSNGGNFTETWEWDGNNWTLRAPAVSPTGRQEHAMAYDAARRVTVLFGGYDGNRNAETWEWDGTTWTPRAPTTAPSARYDHAMSYDAGRGVVVLFGGDVGGGETWEYDGINWTQRAPAASPSPRRYHAMAFDSARGVTVLFGGVDNETWEWDGLTWTKRTPNPLPAARDDHAMAFDTARGATVLFGGSLLAAGAGTSNETWDWAGPKPAISQQPADVTVAPSRPAVISVMASSSNSLMYRWRKDGAPLADGGPIAGATSATLSINPSALADSGQYTCEISNSCGSVLSRSGRLLVDPCNSASPSDDCNANGRLDSCDIAANASLDANSNGALDSCEQPATLPCGACGAGMPMGLLMGLGLFVSTRASRSLRRFRNEKRTGNKGSPRPDWAPSSE